MNSKERIYKAIRHESTDRVPIYIWYHPDVMKSLEKELGKSGKELEVFLCNDIIQTWISINYYQSVVVEEDSRFTDEYGIKWQRINGYNMITDNPIINWDVSALKDYKFPDPDRNSRYTELESLLEKYGAEYFIGADISGTIFEPCSHIRGMEQLLLDMHTNPKDVEQFFDNAMNFSLQIAKNAIDMKVDWVWFGDDVGTQNGMIISPEMWRKYFKPRMRYMISELRKIKKDLIVAYHSCGTVSPIIPDLIEIGIDVLNPIQPKAKDMDMYAIKKEYGNKLTLHCGMDTQELLPFGSLETIKKETQKIIEELYSNGGFIFAASHTIQPDTSNDRILLMLDTIKNFSNFK
jgi:uroporphyrinogen decarboxylase